MDVDINQQVIYLLVKVGFGLVCMCQITKLSQNISMTGRSIKILIELGLYVHGHFIFLDLLEKVF